MQERPITVSNKLGLHARASAKLVQRVQGFRSQVWLVNGTREVNAKSIMGVMMLAAGIGTEVEMEIEGADEAVAHDALTALVNDKFGEGE